MRKKKDTILFAGANIDLIVEKVLHKLLEFSSIGFVDSEIAEKAVRDTYPELKNATLKQTVAIPGYSPFFVFELNKSPEEATLKETGHEQREQKEAFDAIKDFLLSKEDPVSLKIGHITYNDIWDIVWVPEKIKKDKIIHPIADFVLKNKNGEKVVWLSHKGGTRPEDFRQYTGVGVDSRQNINSHPEYQAFKRIYLRWLNENGVWKRDVKVLPRKTVVAKVINSTDLRKMAMFGQYTLGNQKGLEAIHFLIQGKPYFELNNKTNIWELKAKKVVSASANVEKMPMPYIPVFTVRYATDRNDQGFPFSRVSIYPYQGAHGEKDPRRAAEIIVKYI
jgi:hypothetical protein